MKKCGMLKVFFMGKRMCHEGNVNNNKAHSLNGTNSINRHSIGGNNIFTATNIGMDSMRTAIARKTKKMTRLPQPSRASTT